LRPDRDAGTELLTRDRCRLAARGRAFAKLGDQRDPDVGGVVTDIAERLERALSERIALEPGVSCAPDRLDERKRRTRHRARRDHALR
jgi:hypothetical protein